MFLFAALLVVVAVVAPLVPAQEVPNGEKPYDYFRAEARWTETRLHYILDEVDIRQREYVEDLKTSNNASSALKRFTEAAGSAKDTTCASTSDEFRGAQETIDTVITNCANSVPTEDRTKFRTLIGESIAKIREIDNSIRQNSLICTSPRLAPPPSCKATEKKLLADIDEVMSCSELDNFNYYIALTTRKAKDSIYSCVENGTKDLLSGLETATNNLESCLQKSVAV